jgi:hypothetical protein
LGLVPYLLGFRPQESLVFLLIRHNRVLLTARIDLPPIAAAEAVVHQFGALTEQHDASGLVVLAYSNDTAAARELVEAIAPSLLPFGLVDALCVDDERWWSLTCTSGCCPAEGTPYDLTSHPMAAEAVYAGLTAAADRSSIAQQVLGPPEDEIDALSELTELVCDELMAVSDSGWLDLMETTVRDFVDQPHPLTDTECVRLAALAMNIAARDVAWSMISRKEVSAHLQLWHQVVARTVAPFELAPLCMLGFSAWIAGDGALQNCCVERAVRLDPSYSLAELLDEINLRALPPSFWDQMAEGMASGVRGGATPLAG